MARLLSFLRHWVKWILLALVLYLFLSFVLSPLLQRRTAENLPVSQRAVGNCTASERVLAIDDNEEALIWRLRLIEGAQEELVLTTFDFDDDESGQDILAALLSAAERGVHVRMVVDGIRGLLNVSTSDTFRAVAAADGVEVKLYNPIHLFAPWNWNYRMHDKYVIADQTAYLLGGRNTNDLFLGRYADTYNIDRDLLIYEEMPGENSSLSQLQTYFEAIWNLDSCKDWRYSQSDKKTSTAVQSLRERAEGLKTKYPQVYEPVDWVGETMPAERVTLLTNPIEAHNKIPVLWKALEGYWAGASDCIIETPYLICDRMMYDGLTRLASQAESAEVITNATENGANPFGCSDYWNSKAKILEAGVGVYEAIPIQSLHTKTVLIDDHISIVGSYNLDMRSTYLDTELMLAVDSQPLNAVLRENARELMAQSKHVSANGEEVLGENYRPITLTVGKKLFYGALRLIVKPFRYLL